MGCDIHTHIEERVEGKWKHVSKDEVDERNYRLFAILANVRNGYGFAGIPTGTVVKPISDPRGFPDDASEETRKSYNDWEGAGHSHSFFTFRELLDFDWNQKRERQGWVDWKGYRQWKFFHKPDSFSGEIYGHLIRKVPTDVMEKEYENEPENTFTLVRWDEYYYECATTLFRVMAVHMYKQNPENLRIVFWFDN